MGLILSMGRVRRQRQGKRDKGSTYYTTRLSEFCFNKVESRTSRAGMVGIHLNLNDCFKFN